MRRLWHALFAGHVWRVAAQSVCAPSAEVTSWASKFGNDTEKVALVVKSHWGWSECLLLCSCGAIKKIEIIGTPRDQA